MKSLVNETTSTEISHAIKRVNFLKMKRHCADALKPAKEKVIIARVCRLQSVAYFPQSSGMRILLSQSHFREKQYGWENPL